MNLQLKRLRLGLRPGWGPVFQLKCIFRNLACDQTMKQDKSLSFNLISDCAYLITSCSELQPVFSHSVIYERFGNVNTHPALQISCQKSWKKAPRLYVVVAEWECGAPSCVLSVVLDPSPSLCTSI